MHTSSFRFLELFHAQYVAHHSDTVSEIDRACLSMAYTFALSSWCKLIATLEETSSKSVVLNERYIRIARRNVHNFSEEKILTSHITWTPDFNPEDGQIVVHTTVFKFTSGENPVNLKLNLFDAIAMGVSAPYVVSDNSPPVNPARELFEALAEKHVPAERFALGGSSFQWTDSGASWNHLTTFRVMHLRISDDDVITSTQDTKNTGGMPPLRADNDHQGRVVRHVQCGREVRVPC